MKRHGRRAKFRVLSEKMLHPKDYILIPAMRQFEKGKTMETIEGLKGAGKDY